MVRENYRGVAVAFPAGIAIATSALVALVPLSLLDELADVDVFRPGMGQAISESGTIAGPWRHMEKPFFGGGGEDGGYGMILGDFSGELLMAQLPNDGRKALVSERPSHFSLLLAPGNPTRSREQ
jgi:hypothetical protein